MCAYSITAQRSLSNSFSVPYFENCAIMLPWERLISSASPNSMFFLKVLANHWRMHTSWLLLLVRLSSLDVVRCKGSSLPTVTAQQPWNGTDSAVRWLTNELGFHFVGIIPISLTFFLLLGKCACGSSFL